MNWRDLPDLSVADWQKVLAESPLATHATEIQRAASPHGYLASRQIAMESDLGRSQLATTKHNILGLRPRGGGDGFASFDTVVDSVKEWRSRIDSPNYAYRDTTTVEDYIHVYAPSSDGNNEAEYVRFVLAQYVPPPPVVPKGSGMTGLNMTKGLIPLPAMEMDIIDVGRRDTSLACRGYDWLGHRPLTPDFLVLHRAQMDPGGSNSGYFHEVCCPALTDLEVNCVTGHMKRFVNRGDAPSGWANGVVSAPFGDALAWLNGPGGWNLDTVNRNGEACEVTGWFAQPGTGVTREDTVSFAAWKSLAQWIASRAHDYGITYLDFPMVKAQGRSYITWHKEWTIGTGKICPGATVVNGTANLIEMARSIMRLAQIGTKSPVVKIYAPPAFPPFLLKPWTGHDVVYNGTTFHAAKRQYTAIGNTKRLQLGDKDSVEIGPPIRIGETFEGDYWFKSSSDGRAYVLTPFATRVYGLKLTPKVTIRG